MTVKNQLQPVCLEFTGRFKKAGGVMCFLADFMPEEELDGLTMASLRRARLFKEQLGIDVMFLTNIYQSRLTENVRLQVELGRTAKLRLLNLYDYLQGIDRGNSAVPLDPAQTMPSLEPGHTAVPADNPHDTVVKDPDDHCVMYLHRRLRGEQEAGLDYVNYLRSGRIYRRDIYDVLGFVSCTHLIEPATGITRTRLFFRPDHTLALVENCKPDPRHGPHACIEDSVELIDREGHTFQRFSSHQELVAFWLLSLLKDPQCFYLLISERAYWLSSAFREFQRQSEAYPNVRIVCQAHNVHVAPPHDPLTSSLSESFSYVSDRSQRVDAMVTLTSRQKLDIEKRFGSKAPPRINVIPNFLLKMENSPKTENGGIELPPRAIIAVGRLDRGKQWDKALLAFEKTHRQISGATLHFFGTGEDESRLRDLVTEHGLSEQVCFHGFIADLSTVYKQAALLILTSRGEGFPLVILEAISQGCPVVSFDCRYGPAELIENGHNGYLVAPDDTDTLSQRCTDILRDPKLRKKLSQGALSHAKRFEPQKIAAEWAQLFNRLLPEEGINNSLSDGSKS